MPDANPGQPAAAANDAPARARYAFVRGERDLYFVPADLAPTEQYKKAVRLLQAGAGRRAAAMIAEVVDGLFTDDRAPDTSADVDPKAETAPAPNAPAGQPAARGAPEPVSTAVAYHWILAIMSGRAFEQLTPDDFAAIDHARSIAVREAPAGLLAAYDLLCRIVDTLQGQDQNLPGDKPPADDQPTDEHQRPAKVAAADSLADEASRLEDPFRKEIYRHLGAVLTGRITEEAEAALAADARSPQKTRERKSQAWKYFEQVPALPLEQTFIDPILPMLGRVLAACAGLLCLVAIPLAVGVLQERGVVRALILSAVILLATVVTIRSRITALAASERIADKDSEFGDPDVGRAVLTRERHVSRYYRPVLGPGIGGIPVSAGSREEAEKARQATVRTARFTRLVSGLVDEQFAQAMPPDQATRTQWMKETAGLKDTVRDEMLFRYSDSATRPGALNWLIDWRVREITEKFNAGQLRAYQQQMLPSARVALGFALGAVVSVVAWVYAAFLVLIQRPVPGAIALVLIAAAALLVAVSRVDIYLVHNRRLPDDRADAQRQRQADLNAYKDWQNAIADPPSDEQIAYWLDLDKIRLMKLFMAQAGVPRQHVLAQATLTEVAPGCVGRRMPHGPPRYSAYKVTIFLLTRVGIRLTAMTLNFLTGEAFDQVRRAFRYDTMVSARVQESGIRYYSASRRAMPAPAYPWANGQNGSSGGQDAVRRNIDGSVIPRQELRLSIGDGEGLRFLVEVFESIGTEYSEDAVELLDLALDVSGFAAALELLETACGADRYAALVISD